MKKKRLTKLAKIVPLSICVVVIAFLFDSCSAKIAFATSSVVPAARGSVKIKKDRNHNYVIQVHVENLAEVKRLQPSRQTYVVWMVSGQEVTKNIGQIHSSSGTFSKNLKASFETVSSVKPYKIFITAEDDANAQSPGTYVIATDNF
jgi:hypothetical protein